MTPQPSARLREAIAHMTAVPTRRPVRDWLATLAVLAVTGVAALALLGLRRDLAELPTAWVLGFAAAWLLGLAGLSRAVLVPPRGHVLPRAPLAGMLAATFGAVSIVAGFALATRAPSSTVVADTFAAFAHYAAACFTIGIAVATGPVLFALWRARGTAPVATRWLAAGIGAAGGALGSLVLHFYCPIANANHLGIVHGGVPLLAAGLAALAGLRLLDRPR